MKSTYKRLLEIAVPITLVQLSASAIALTDTFFVTVFKPSALATLGGATGILIFVQSTLAAALMATDGYVSQSVAKNSKHHKRDAVSSAMLFAAILSVLSVLCAVVALRVNVTPELKFIASFLAISFLSLPFTLAFMIFQKYWNATGSAQTMLRINLAGIAVNALADWALILYLTSAPASADAIALSTVIARAFTFVLAILYTVRQSGWSETHALFVPKYIPNIQVPILRLGVTNAANGAIDCGVYLFLSATAIYFGTRAMEVNQFATMIALVFFQPYIGIGTAATILVARELGRQRPQNAAVVAQRAVRFSILFGIGSTLVLMIMSLSLATMAGQLALVVACIGLYQIADSVQGCSAGILRAANIGLPQLKINFISFYIFGLILFGILFQLDTQLFGSWLALSCGIGLSGFLHYLAFVKWQRSTKGG